MIRKIITTVLVSSIFVSLYSQGWIYSNSTIATYIEPGYSIINNNSLYTLSNFLDTIYSPVIDTSHGAGDILLQKYDLQGNFQWSRHIGSDTSDLARGIDTDSEGNIYISGSFGRLCKFQNNGSITSTSSNDAFLAKYDPNGNLLWKKSICRGSGPQNTVDLIIDDNDNIIVLGYFRNNMVIGDPLSRTDTLYGYTYYSPFLSKFSKNGDLIWAKNYETTAESYFRRIAITDNGYYLGGPYIGTINLDVGSFTSVNSNTDILLYKTDTAGVGEWARSFYGINAENFRSLETDEYDNIFLLGTFQSPILTYDSTSTETNNITNSGGYDSFVAKYNRSGNLQWMLKRASLSSDYFNDIAIRNNLICATGYFTGQIIFGDITLNSSSPTNQDVFFVALNNLGDPIHAASIVGTGNFNDRGINILIDDLSRAYVIGYYKSPSIQIGTTIYSNSHNNKSDQFIAVYQHPLKAIITDENMVSCNGASDGMLKVTGYFGRLPYSYSWSHDANLHSNTAEDLAPGEYTVTITDANSNTASVTSEITQPQALSITEIITPVTCFNYNDGGISITVSGGTGDYDYFWTTFDGSGIIPLNQNQVDLSGGTYTVEVHDENSCSVTENFIVGEPSRFNYDNTIITNITIPPGNNGSIDLTVTGGNSPYSFEWTGPGGLTTTSEDTALLSDAGLYNLLLTDSEGCTSDTSFAVLDGVTFFAQITSKTDINCFGFNTGSATVTAYYGTTPYTYAWSSGSNSSTATGLGPGLHTVTVRDLNLNEVEASVFINSPSAALFIDLDAEPLVCHEDNSGVLDLTVTGGTLPYSYLWDNGYTGEDLVNVAADEYTITVTDGNGCIKIDTKEITEPPDIGLSINAPANQILCHGDNTAMATANVTPPASYSFLWDDPGTQNTQTATNLEAGTYNVRVTNSDGCFKTANVLIPEPDPLTVTALLNRPSCPGDEDGSIIPTPAGGTGTGYEYIWSNGVFQRFNTNLEAGIYSLILNDANNCTISDTFNLTDPDTIKISNIQKTDPTCTGISDGSIIVTATGGTGPYEYSVNNGLNFSNNATIGLLAANEYIVVVRDDKECLSEPGQITLNLSNTCALVIYDAFSPNGDDRNPEWNIGNVQNFPNITVKIFNLWGKMIFSSQKGYADPWDGTYEGKELPSGTYYYVIDPGDGSDILSGSVNIVK